MAYSLPPLAYPYNALEPHIDARTMEIHHTKHHQAYINNANNVLKDNAALDAKSVEELLRDFASVPDAVKTPLRNNAGGHANHTLFWEVIGPNGGGNPTGALAEAINAQLGGFDKFKEEFAKAATTRFGSGWAWLVVTKDKKLAVTSTPNQDSPLMDGQTPILGLDVWEHAYYLNYQNRRPDYIAAFWNVVKWNVVADKFAAALK